MESAYIYVRVSTDEQARTGYSLVEQEERLLSYCEISRINVKGIFREDFSAKDFNRPEWKRLIELLKKNKHRPQENILFLKWDRFSRNIEYAYQMIGILKELNVRAMAIDQLIDFEVPESIVMLAIYLSIPEAENSRRGRNTSDGIRRAKKMGRCPGKAPIGYCNQTAPDGRKFIAPKQPEASHVKWAFQEFAKGYYSISQVRKMACLNGFQCSRNNFWKLLRNPVYCGIITVPPTKTEDVQFVKAVHEPIISESLFTDVQLLLSSKRRQGGRRENLKYLFPLRGFLQCPYCNHKLTGSISQGRRSKYRYYHCRTPKCKGRFRADILDSAYEDELKKLRLNPKVYELFTLILQDENIFSAQKEYRDERQEILDEIIKQQALISKARKLLLTDKIELEDFNGTKKECKQILECLSERLNHINVKLMACSDGNGKLHMNLDILQPYNNHDIVGKRQIISMFSPTAINIFDNTLGPLQLNDVLAKIIDVSEIEIDHHL